MAQHNSKDTASPVPIWSEAATAASWSLFFWECFAALLEAITNKYNLDQFKNLDEVNCLYALYNLFVLHMAWAVAD